MRNRIWVPSAVILFGVLLIVGGSLVVAYDTLPSYSPVRWVGHMVVALPGDSPGAVALEDVELGLRGDGVVVWREKTVVTETEVTYEGYREPWE